MKGKGYYADNHPIDTIEAQAFHARGTSAFARGGREKV
jgi:hypothetical protein